MPRSHHVSTTTLVKMTAAAAANLSRRKIMATYPEAPERLVNAIIRSFGHFRGMRGWAGLKPE